MLRRRLPLLAFIVASTALAACAEISTAPQQAGCGVTAGTHTCQPEPPKDSTP